MKIFVLIFWVCETFALQPLLVKKWARLMGEEIDNLMENGLKYKEIQKIYDDANYEQINVEWIKKVEEIHGKLGMSFVKKRAALDILAQEAANYFDNLMSIGFPLNKSLKDLGPKVFIDSDTMVYTMNKSDSVHDDSHSILNRSSVKIPSMIPRTNQKIINTVWWTANLEKVFKQNIQRDPDIRYQYFASKNGVFRSFPIRPWEKDMSGRNLDYDPRIRPWFVAALTKPKNVVIIYDASSTNVKSKSRALSVIRSIFNTLTSRDYVSVIISRSSYFDVNGKRYTLEPYVLGCTNQTTLLPANPSFTFKLLYLLNRLDMDGGSDYTRAFRLAFEVLSKANNELCHNLILFITDGITLDGSQRCDPGRYYYDYDSAKRFVPGSVCIFDHKKFLRDIKDFQTDLAAARAPLAFIFTFTTTDHAHSFFKSLSCDNYGMRIPVWNKRISMTRSLAPYYHFLRNLSGEPGNSYFSPVEQIWISPYLDAINSDLIITASKAVYSNTGKFIGVVGIDITLDTIENLLSKETWNSVSYFVIDKYGHAILHPLIKHSEELLGDPIFIHITLLEQFAGRPSEFDEVLRRMLRREIGTQLIEKDAFIAFYNGEYQEGLSWKPIYNIQYTFGPLQGSDFSFAFKVPFSDRLFRIPTITGSPRRTEIFMTDYEGYAKIVASAKLTRDFLSQIQTFLDTLVKKPQGSVSYNYSGVHLSPRAFCSPEEYLFHNKPSLETMHVMMNTPHQPEPCDSPDGYIKPYIKSDVILTSQMENVWKARDPAIQSNIISTFLSTFNGVTRVYPAIGLPRSMEPLKQAWFNKALLNLGKNVINPTYRPYFRINTDRIITMSKTVMLGRPHCIPGSRINDGCPCTRDLDCTSNYCYLKSRCSNAITHAVAGMNFKFNSLRSALYNSVKDKLSQQKHCNSIYPCPNDPTVSCTINCIIINNSTQVVIHPNFSSQSLPDQDEDSAYSNVFLELIEPLIFYHLFDSHLLYSFHSTDFQAVCTGNNTLNLNDLGDNAQGDPTKSSDGQRYNCIKEVTLFAVNRTKLSSSSSSIFSHAFNTSICVVKYYFTQIPNSNLYLIVLEDRPLIDICWKDIVANSTILFAKKDFSLCRDYSYAQRFPLTNVGVNGSLSYNNACPVPKTDYNVEYCSRAHTSLLFNLKITAIKITVLLFLTLLILFYF